MGCDYEADRIHYSVRFVYDRHRSVLSGSFPLFAQKAVDLERRTFLVFNDMDLFFWRQLWREAQDACPDVNRGEAFHFSVQKGIAIIVDLFCIAAVCYVIPTAWSYFAKQCDILPVLAPGIKLCAQIEADVTDDFLTFLEQISIEYVYAWFNESQYNYDYLSRLRERVERYGIILFNVGAVHVAKSRSIILGKPDRDKDIEMFNNCLRMLSRVGIHTTTFTWEPDGVWASDWDYITRGGALTRKCDMRVLEGCGICINVRYTQVPIDREQFYKDGLTHGCIYTRDEIWDNYTYSIRRVVPVAEEYGVRLALHPNDPPVDSIAGVACLIRSFDDFKRAFEIGGSEFLGMEFCCGCWLEAANTFGDVFAAIDYFVKQNKVFLVHFRNVDTVLPSCLISDETAIRDALRLMEGGADLVYATGMRLDRIKVLTYQHIPCVAHLGLVPYFANWTGGFKAVGKTAEEAQRLYQTALELDDAGVICAEMECIPHQIASYISRRVSFITYSMGSGTGCDGQYLFACDLLGSHNNHYPRHSIRYENFFDRSVEIFRTFINDVNSGAYPADKHMINMQESEYLKFFKGYRQ